MPSEPATERPRHDRTMRIALAVVLASSVAVAVVTARRMLLAPPIWNDEPLAWAKVAIYATALFSLVVWRFARHAAAAVTLTTFIVAAALIGPGPVLTVAVLLITATIAGTAVIARADAGNAVPWTLAMLIGVALAIGAFELASRVRMHYAPVHAALAFIVVVLGRKRLRDLVAQLAQWIATPSATTATERVWMVVGGIVAVVHIVAVAKPEVGYDASTMHLQFAEIVAAQHRFRHDVGRFLWAAMPLGADYAFATAFLVGGEAAARSMNLAFGALACALVHRLALGAGANREFALAAATLFASMPLALLVTGSLFSETLWAAFLLAALVVVNEDHARRSASWLPALALVAGGAMATKVISVLWLAPLLACAGWIAWRDRAPMPTRRGWLQVWLGAAIGAWPYVTAWIATGNPVFPFMNSVFRSPLYDTTTSFNNAAYNAPLVPWTPWDLVLHSARFIEGRDGALGLAWLVALPLVIVHFLRRRPRTQWAPLAVAVVFFVAVYLQQSYLRYLLPAFAATAAVAAVAASNAFVTRTARWLAVAAGVALVAFDVRSIAAAHHPHATPCLACMFDARARERYVVVYAPLRAVAARMNRELPEARVGFMLPNEPAPAGYTGVSRSGNWHDGAFFRPLVDASDAQALLELARRHRLTHVVYRASPDPAFAVIADFAKRYTTPLWRIDDYVVASVRSEAER